MGKLSATEILEANLTDWRLFGNQLHARFLTGDFKSGADLLAAITDAAEEANHHPDVTLTYPWVDIQLMSHDVGSITDRDISMATRISAIASNRGIVSDPTKPVRFALGLDSGQFPAVGKFWAVVLTGSAESFDGEDLIDPNGRVPWLWLQQTEPHQEPRQRFHVDLWVPPEQLEQRIEAALQAGGTLVDDSNKPSYTVLADPEGNKVCLCTTMPGDF